MSTHPDPERDKHDRLRDQLGAHVLGQLENDERIEIEGHLAGCDDCRVEYAELAPLVAPLARIDPDATDPEPDSPSAAGFAAILRRVAREQSLDAPTVTASGPGSTAGRGPRRLVATSARPATPAHGNPVSLVAPAPPPGDRTDGDLSPDVVALRPRRRTATRLLVAAAVVVAFTIGALTADLGLSLRTGGPEPRPVAVQALAPGIDASAGTIDHTWGVEMVLTATGFTAGQTYDVAVLGRDGRTVSAGAFIGSGGTEMVCRLNAAVLRGQADGFVVTDTAGTEVLRSRFT